MAQTYAVGMKQILVMVVTMVLLGCGKKAPEQQAEATLTPGIEAALKAHEAGNYREAVRLYTKELTAEEAKPMPSWVQLSYLHNQLGLALDYAGLYDKALEHYQKALAIDLKQLGPEHPYVAGSYYNMAYVHEAKKDLAKAMEYWEKAYAIRLKKLGPNHPNTKRVKGQLDALKE